MKLIHPPGLHTSRRRALKLGAATVGGFLLNRGALAADSIRLIVLYAQGSLADSAAKLIQEPFAKAMGMAVVIDYVTGEGGQIAARETIRSKPDSRTLLMHRPDTLAVWEFKGDKLLADLRPVAKLTYGMSMAFAVRSDSALKNWQGMAAASKGSALTMADPGGGFLVLDMVKKHTGISFTTQLTDGSPSSAALVLSGKAALAYLPTHWVLTHNEKATAKDKLRFLATFGAQRAPELPHVPTFAEIMGDRKAATTYSYAVWSAANADTAFTDKATAALLSIAKTPKMLAQARKLRIPLQIDGPQVVLKTLKRDRRVMQAVYG
jgi:tripartite-type tricarboxylate transporter receptor subunit TctC